MLTLKFEPIPIIFNALKYIIGTKTMFSLWLRYNSATIVPSERLSYAQELILRCLRLLTNH